MTLARDTRKYRKQSAKDIVSAVLDRSGLKYAWRTERTTPRRNYCVQYRELNYTDKHARFRAQFHWDREAKGTDDDSRWLRAVQESASSTFLARVGWEMNVAYIDGDPDRPIGLARNINRVMPPAYGQPGKKTVMTIKTPTTPANGGFNEIRLDDSGGMQEFYVRAPRVEPLRQPHSKRTLFVVGSPALTLTVILRVPRVR